MRTNDIKVRSVDVCVPDYYQRLETMPEDPPCSVALGTRMDMGTAFVICYPMSASCAMPYDDPQSIIDGIHGALADDQGLVEVAGGTTNGGLSYVYSIVKTAMGEHGLQYSLTMDLGTGDPCTHFQGFFDEGPTTGIRASVAFEMLRKKGEVGSDMTGWMRDPYDPERTTGYLANRGEAPEFDALFPEHPLSLARELVRSVTGSL